MEQPNTAGESPEIPEDVRDRKSRAWLETWRTWTDAKLLDEGAHYVIENGEKRLELTAEQVEAARHEMERELEEKANENIIARRLGLETLDELPEYHVLSSMEIKLEDRNEVACCALEGYLYDRYSGAKRDIFKGVPEKVLEKLYERYPDLKSLGAFVLVGDFGKAVVKEDSIHHVPWRGYEPLDAEGNEDDKEATEKE